MFATKRYAFETLEARQVLSAHALARGFAALHHGSDRSDVPVAVAGQLHGSFRASVTALHASLTDSTNSDVSGSVQFLSVTRRGETNARFVASIRGAEADTTYDVSIDGTVVGQITTNEDGAGRLVLSSKPHGNQEELPENFPTDLAAGATVSVGTATGELESRFGHQGDDDDDDDSGQTRLAAFLSDPADSSIHGFVKFHSETEDDGTTETKFAVKVTGADADTTLDVVINGETIGAITTNAAGRGTLVLSSEDGNLPANFPATLTAGDTVTVGAATGDLTAVHDFGRHRR